MQRRSKPSAPPHPKPGDAQSGHIAGAASTPQDVRINPSHPVPINRTSRVIRNPARRAPTAATDPRRGEHGSTNRRQPLTTPTSRAILIGFGRVAQWESTVFTRQGSLVRTQPRPPVRTSTRMGSIKPALRRLFWLCPSCAQAVTSSSGLLRGSRPQATPARHFWEPSFRHAFGPISWPLAAAARHQELLVWRQRLAGR